MPNGISAVDPASSDNNTEAQQPQGESGYCLKPNGTHNPTSHGSSEPVWQGPERGRNQAVPKFFYS